MLNLRPEVGPLFRALADDNRRAILVRLSEGPATVSELAETLPVSLAATVQHVQTLEGAGLVVSGKEGRTRTCQLAPEGLDPAEAWIAERKAVWEQRLDRFAAALERASGSTAARDRREEHD